MIAAAVAMRQPYSQGDGRDLTPPGGQSSVIKKRRFSSKAEASAELNRSKSY